MGFQTWVSLASIIAVIVGIITLTHTLRKDREDREAKRKEEWAAREKTRQDEAKKREDEIAASVKQWTELNDHIGQMQEKITSIDHTIGNGFAGSIKDQIRDLKENCTCKMVALEKQVGFDSPRLKELEDRVREMERQK
jgi:hypothetical protein